MKKFFALLMAVLTVLCMTACGKETEKVIVKENDEFTLNTEDKTISDGENTYEYEIDGSGDSYRITIDYPDGAQYFWSMSEGVGSGGWNSELTNNSYAKADILVEVAEEDFAPEVESNPWFIVIILGVLGLAGLIYPYGLWWLAYGWRYKDVEPSEIALIAERVVGGAFVIIAVVLAIIFIV